MLLSFVLVAAVNRALPRELWHKKPAALEKPAALAPWQVMPTVFVAGPVKGGTTPSPLSHPLPPLKPQFLISSTSNPVYGTTQK